MSTDYALDLLGVILGQGESSRLVQTVRDEKRLVNSVEAYNLSFGWGEGFFGVDAVVAVPPDPAQRPGHPGPVAGPARDANQGSPRRAGPKDPRQRRDW